MGVIILSSARLEYIPPDRLGDVWEYVKTGLMIVLCKTRERWRIEDVRRDLEDHVAQLFLAVDGDICGFFVAEKIDDRMWIRIGHFADLRKWISEIKSLSDAAGCRAVAFASPRKGWMKYGAGIRPVATIFELE